MQRRYENIQIVVDRRAHLWYYEVRTENLKSMEIKGKKKKPKR